MFKRFNLNFFFNLIYHFKKILKTFMSKIPFINKKYIFLQNLLYQSIDIVDLKKQKLHSVSTYPFITLNEKKQLNSLSDSNLGSLNSNKSEMGLSQQTKIKSHENFMLLTHRKNNFFRFNKNTSPKISLGNQKILKAIGSKPFLNSLGTSLPYKKSLFCYWLLPFIGLISTISMITDSKTLFSNSLNQNLITQKFFENNFPNTNSFNNSTQIYYLKNSRNSIKHLNSFSSELNSNSSGLNIESFSNLIEKFYNSDYMILEKKIMDPLNNSSNINIGSDVPFYSYLNWQILKNFKQNESNLSATWLNSSLNLSSISKNLVHSHTHKNNFMLDQKSLKSINIHSINKKSNSSEAVKNKNLTLGFAKRLENDSYLILNNLIFPNLFPSPKIIKNSWHGSIEKNVKLIEKNRIPQNYKKSTIFSWMKNPLFLLPKHKISFLLLKQNVLKDSSIKSSDKMSNFLVGVSTKKANLEKLKNRKFDSKLNLFELNLNSPQNMIQKNKVDQTSNLTFFLEMDEKSYLPNFLTTHKTSLNNPLSSYKRASLLLDEIIDPKFTKKLDTWITKNSLKNMPHAKPSLDNLQKHLLNSNKFDLMNKIELKDIYSSMSIFKRSGDKQNNSNLEKLSLNEIDLLNTNLNQEIKPSNIEKTNFLLEKSIVFLLKKQVFQKNLNLKDSFKVSKMNEPLNVYSNSNIKKLNKDSLYFLIFNSLKTSLNHTMTDNVSLIHSNENLEEKLNDFMISKSSFDLTRFKAKLLKKPTLINLDLNVPIIKLTHPLWVSNVNKKTTQITNLGFNTLKPQSLLNVDNFKINQIFKETKTQSNGLNLFYQNGQKSDKDFAIKSSRVNVLLEKTKLQPFPSKNLLNGNYLHFSKYLHFLSKKIKNIWLNPINSNFSKPLTKPHQKFLQQKNKKKSNDYSLPVLKKRSPVVFVKHIDSKQTIQDLNFVKSVSNKISTKRNVNPLRLKDFTKSSFLRLNPFILKSSKNINFHIKKKYDQRQNQFKSHLFRLEKIFRSYLSKKNTIDKNRFDRIATPTKLLKTNKIEKKQNSNILKNSLYKTFLKLPKTSYLREKTFNKLGVTDSNYLLSTNQFLKNKNTKLFFIKNNSFISNKKVNVKEGNMSYELSPTLYLKNRAFILKGKTKRISQIETNLKSMYILKKILIKNQSFKNLLSDQTKTNMVDLIKINSLKNQDISLNNQNLNKQQVSLNNSSEYQSLLEKRNYEKKKRRKKKQRKETRRRKKRKRFFPRPFWLRFKLYTKFLKSRHLKTFINKNLLIPSTNLNHKIFSQTSLKSQISTRFKSFDLNNKIEDLSLTHLEKVLYMEKISRNYKQMWTNNIFQKGSMSQSDFQGTQNKNPYTTDSQYFSFFVNKDFYQVSRTVLGDLKRVFWKSYWLRSNLNPYLNRVKTYLNHMQNSTKNWSIYLNLRNLSNSILGINMSNRQLSQSFSGVHNVFDLNLPKYYDPVVFEKDQFKKINSEQNSMNSVNQNYFNIKNYLQNCQDINFSSNKWQIAVNVTEYQRIMYERIQQTILNIRENLNLNGQIRARSSRNGRKKLLTPKPVKDFWIKFGKAITFEIPNNQAVEFYGDISKVRRWWTLNKSNLAMFKASNKRKDLWISQKLREQSKSNKTKKIIYQMIKNLNNGLDENTTLLNSSNLSNLLIKSLTIKPFFNRFMIDKPEPIKTQTINFADKIDNVDLKSKNSLIFDKLKRSLEISEQKLRKKENKIAYLGFFNKKISQSSLQKNYFRSLKKQFQRSPLVDSFEMNEKIQTNVSFNKFTSEYNYWWKGENLALKIIPSFKNASNLLDSNVSLLLASTFLFHFCALISLLSSTEVRGLLKFYTILGSKIFKIYLDIIFSVSQFMLNPFNSILKLNLKNSQHQFFDKNLNSFQNNSKETSIFQQFLFTFSLPFTSKQRHKTLKQTYLNQAVSKALIWSSFSKYQQWVKSASTTSSSNLSFENSSSEIVNKKDILNRNSNIQLNDFSITNLKEKTLYSFKDQILPKKDSTINNFLNLNFSNNSAWTFYFGVNSNKSNLSMLKHASSLKKNKLNQLAYLSLLYLITKPMLWFECLNMNQKKKLKSVVQNSKADSDIPVQNLELNSKDNKKQFVLFQNKLISKKIFSFNKLFFLSSLNFVISSSYKGSYSLYTWLIKSLDIFQAVLGSIYLFFEKPGELIVDWIAYAFLVEWSSDLTTTIPDALDISTMSSYFKISRGVRPFMLSQSLLMFSPIGLSNGLIQRQMWQFYQSMVEQLCQPDTDLLIRQKKGMIFWDIWAELLIDVAEDANINISELTSLKEEQNRLLDKLEQSASSNFTMFKHKNLKNPNLPNLQSFGKNSFFANSIHLLNSKKNLSKKTKIIKNSNFLNTKILKSDGLWISTKINQKQLTWSVNQFLSYQGKDTELFIDLHPPKSFSHLPSIKYSQSIQQPIGTIICQIFSGIFNQQIAKNILVVGSSGNEKTLLIQAIAGETELKIITDNAQRYAMVYRGVAVGIKLLRDVFEALSLHTPCIFLLEDIHHIGERRPFLISDDENAKATEFGSEKEEIHEKNQVIYQLSKHFVSHYKKPYKGDFSLLIPTNHFCFNLFLGVSSPRTRSYQVTPSNPLQFNKSTKDQNQFSYDSNKKQTKNQNNNILSSSLQIKSDQLLAPPATSPFSVLILKEEKKLKPKQIVKEMPWSGLPGEQLALISKANYSIRVKIALLADMALSNVSVKLDMITDLLVIIDSVKGNRGFIVFATTHLPYILDPALRRPGRFDETIALPLIPNLFSRWEILKTNFSYFTQPSLYSSFQIGSTVDFTNISGFFDSNFQSSKLSDKLVSFNKKIRPNKLANKAGLLISKKGKIHEKNLTLSYHLTTKEEPLINPTQLQYAFSTHENQLNINQMSKSSELKHNFVKSNKRTYLKLNSIHSIHELKDINHKSIKKPLPKTFFNLIAKTYFSMSRILNHLTTTNLNSSQLYMTQKVKDVEKTFIIPPIDLISFDSNIYLSLYASNKTLKEHLTHLMAGKLGELFAFSNYKYSQSGSFDKYEKNLTNFNIKMNVGLMSLYGIDKTWRSASSLLFSVITKRYLYNKHLMTPKLFHFSNYASLNEAPTPPSSNILLPLKRYENYRRTFNAEQSKHKANVQGNFLQTTLELHQQQRLVKRLYKLPIREFFKSEIISDKLTGFGNSSITLSSVEKNLMKLTNIQLYYRHRILNRHRNYLNTQWWNAQLSEHNTESTFLSDIDWRYTFVESIGDIFIDFPDSDQFYNPRNRRWILTSGSWNNWFNFEKTTLYDIYQQYTFDCFTKVYNSLDQHREILDFYAYTSLNQCMLHHLKEITMINIFKRFS